MNSAILLLSSELEMLRAAGAKGGTMASPPHGPTWPTASELCRLGLLRREGTKLLLTDDGRKVLQLSEQIPEGRGAYISQRKWSDFHPSRRS